MLSLFHPPAPVMFFLPWGNWDDSDLVDCTMVDYTQEYDMACCTAYIYWWSCATSMFVLLLQTVLTTEFWKGLACLGQVKLIVWIQLQWEKRFSFLFFLSQERDSLKDILSSYESEVTINHSVVSQERITKLEGQLELYKQELQCLEGELEASHKNKIEETPTVQVNYGNLYFVTKHFGRIYFVVTKHFQIWFENNCCPLWMCLWV